MRPSTHTAAARATTATTAAAIAIQAAVELETLTLGAFGGTALVAGARWSFAGKDAGSVNSQSYWRD